MSTGFSYPQPIFQSPIYNPAFYLTLDASGFLTYDYAQTLYLSKTDYRLTYISGITIGQATEGVALVPGVNADISGIGALSCSSLTVDGSPVSTPPAYVLSITPGSAAASKALVLNATSDISGINSLSASSLTGTLQTAAQPYITSLDATAYRQAGTTYDLSSIGKLSLTTNGIAEASKALVLDSLLNMRGVVALELNHSSTTISNSSMMSSYALLIRSKSNTVGSSTGICFAATTSAIGSSTGGASILFTDTGANSVGYLSINLKPSSAVASTALTEAIRITADGFVGINQANPSEMLDIVGNAYISGDLLLAGGGLYSNGGSLRVIDQFGVVTPASLTTSTLTVATIVPTTRAIPGSTSASGVIWYSSISRYFGQRVISSDEISLLSYSAGGTYNDYIRWNHNVGSPVMNITEFTTLNAINTNSTTMIYLNSSDRCGIKNTSPEATLHVGGTLVANSEIYTKGNSSANASYRGNWSSANYWGSGSDATVGSIRFGVCDATGAWVSYVAIRVGSYTNASDERLKTDIVDVPYGLESVMMMKPRKYSMIQEQTNHVGFIAQELADIIPECVQQGANDDLNPSEFPVNPWGKDLASLTSVLCRAIQELKEEVDLLKALISE
ncbi:hypothetical protein PC110_g14816 [Phytophthora cactorum]|uniref:Peptidase S74 domain-containing protein n=2 Tax=Phytophthora cactorum TaxID=29920 RepID=A0A329RVL0_9STRA|nr:hypothetical protein PC110_g14816 [Phytophthora cactorum]